MIEPTLLFVGTKMAGGLDVLPPELDTEIAAYQEKQVTKVEPHARDLAEATAEHTRIAEETTARLRARGRQAEAVIRAGDAAAEIITAAADVAADLVVIGSRGRTGLTRVVLGSVARNVLHGSTASVMVVHEPKA